MSFFIGIAGASDTAVLSVSPFSAVSGLSRTVRIAATPITAMNTDGITNDQRQLNAEASAPDTAHAAKWPKMTVIDRMNDARSRCAPWARC